MGGHFKGWLWKKRRPPSVRKLYPIWMPKQIVRPERRVIKVERV
jgi:hypothetical protein